MNLSLYTWNSLAINDANPFTSFFPRGQKVNLSATPITVARTGDFPLLLDTVLNAPRLQIGVIIAAGNSINTNREVLKRYFNITDKTKRRLVARDGDDSNKQYYVTGFPIQVNH